MEILGQSCSKCRFFSSIEQQQGLCRINAPTVTFHLIPRQGIGGVEPGVFPVSGWPTVLPGQWCGKFQPAAGFAIFNQENSQ